MMRASLKLDPARFGQARGLCGGYYRLGPAGDPDDSDAGGASFGPIPIEREDLPYRVELWDEGRTAVEQVLAVTANGSIGYAAYYAATREFPHRYITLRHKNRIVSRWNAPQH
jgi:hypothetical protein